MRRVIQEKNSQNTTLKGEKAPVSATVARQIALPQAEPLRRELEAHQRGVAEAHAALDGLRALLRQRVQEFEGLEAALG